MTKWMVNYDGPVYMRTCRNDVEEITKPGDDPIAPAIMREGRDVALVACGTMVFNALKAADILAEKGISARVINVPCLKPFNDEAVRAALEGVRAIVTCEEHSVIGGLSTAVAMALRGDGRPMKDVAVQDMFGQSAEDAEELMVFYHLTDKDIAEKAESML